MSALNQLFRSLKVSANVFHNGQYHGSWAVDTSGSGSTSFHVVSHGDCVLNVNGENFRLAKGDAVFLPSDAKHTLSDSENSTVEINQQTSLPMCSTLSSDSTGLICGSLNNQHPLGAQLMSTLPEVVVVKKEDQAAASLLIELLIKEGKEIDQHSHFLFDQLANALFYILIRDHTQASHGILAAMLHPKLKSAIELIHENMNKRHSNEDLADASAMSRSSFAAQFKEIVGVPPSEYQTQWRMLCAYRWLADEKASTLDAALRCGYESEASFSKAFKRIIGKGPGEVRKT